MAITVNTANETESNSRKKIVEAAMKLFALHGFDKTSTRMIAKEAGVSLGLMYNYFNGKEELLKSIFLQSLSDVHKSLKPAENAGNVNVFEAVINKTFYLLDEHRNFWRMFYLIRWQPQVIHLIYNELESWKSEMFSSIEKMFLQLGVEDPETEAKVYQALIDGIAQMYVMQPENYPIEKIKQLVIKQYTQKL